LFFERSYSKILSRKKINTVQEPESMTLVEALKNEYEELKKGVCHPWFHVGPSELYACHKEMNPSSRITKDNFFICYLGHYIRRRDGKSETLVYKSETSRIIFNKVTGKNIKPTQYPDQNLIYRILLRYPHLILDSLKAQKNRLAKNFRTIEYLINPAIKDAIINVGKLRAIKIVLSEEKESVEKIQRLAKERKRIYLRDIQRKTGMKISDFHRIVEHYDGDIGLTLHRGKMKNQLIFEPNPDAKVLHPFDRILAEIKDGMIPVKPSTIK
jgi:hypothetical protein